MCVSYGISLCLCEIRIYLFGLFTFAKLPDNSINFCLILKISQQIGCGWSNFMDGSRWKRIVVCNYGPGGNTRKKSMYNQGDPCSACPSGTTCKNALCA